MAMLLKFFQKQSLPTSNDVELPDAVRREVNSAMQKVWEEERNEASGRTRKYTDFTPEDRAKIAKYAAQCENTAAVKHFAEEFPSLGESTVHMFIDLDCACVLPHYLNRYLYFKD